MKSKPRRIASLHRQIAIYGDVARFSDQYEGRLIVIKFGGALAEDDNVVSSIGRQAVYLKHHMKANVIVVHGGGRQIDEALTQSGIQTRRDREGLRITDLPALKISDASLRGLNGHIVSLFNAVSKNVSALGIAGYDGRAVLAHVLNEYTGKPAGINREYLAHLLKYKDSDIIPVIYPICANTHPVNGETRLNVNADDVAATLAAEMGATRLILCSDIPGVLGKGKRLIRNLSTNKVDRLVDDEIVTDGMIPKLRAAVAAAENLDHGGVVILNGLIDGAILAELLSKKGTGTLIQKPSP
jgi:acetylglutamate kinase